MRNIVRVDVRVKESQEWLEVMTSLITMNLRVSYERNRYSSWDYPEMFCPKHSGKIEPTIPPDQRPEDLSPNFLALEVALTAGERAADQLLS
jgi:hypothetical protein